MNKRTLIQVDFDNDADCYEVTIPEGSNALEVVFCMSVITKLFERDGIMSREEVLSNLNRYLSDPQYEEVKS